MIALDNLQFIRTGDHLMSIGGGNACMKQVTFS